MHTGVPSSVMNRLALPDPNVEPEEEVVVPVDIVRRSIRGKSFIFKALGTLNEATLQVSNSIFLPPVGQGSCCSRESHGELACGFALSPWRYGSL